MGDFLIGGATILMLAASYFGGQLLASREARAKVVTSEPTEEVETTCREVSDRVWKKMETVAYLAEGMSARGHDFDFSVTDLTGSVKKKGKAK